MTRFCITCGAELKDGARFCGSCGAPVVEEVVAEPASVEPEPPVAAPSPVYVAPVETAPTRTGPNWLLIGGGALILLLLLYYVIFVLGVFRGDRVEVPATSEKLDPAEVANTKYYAVAEANIRDKATTVGTKIVGKLARGLAVEGTLVTGDDGTTPWLELSDGKGFVAMSNLSETLPPEIVKPLGDRVWLADKPLDLYAQPDAAAPILDRVAAGTSLTLFGLTANDYVEIKRPKGGVAYIADGARIAEASNAKGKPVAISFNPASCNFGGELEVEFQKLAAKSRAAYEAADRKDYASDEARDKVMGDLEGKSWYQRLERSYNGLSITGIAQHYESQSVYFADAPDKVIAAFRTAGHKIGRDGQFPSTELYAGIGLTAGEGRSYGKTDLSCGV